MPYMIAVSPTRKYILGPNESQEETVARALELSYGQRVQVVRCALMPDASSGLGVVEGMVVAEFLDGKRVAVHSS